MNHGINVLTIAKTPVTKKCLNKLGLKKNHRYIHSEINNRDNDEETGETFQHFVSTPPFFTKRKKNARISPLFPLIDDSNSDNSIQKPDLYDESFKYSSINSLHESDVIPTNKGDKDLSIEISNHSIQSLSSLNETPKNNESIPSDITPETANVMDSLYGGIWRSTPGLFKNKKCKPILEKEKKTENEKDSNLENEDDLNLIFKSLNIHNEKQVLVPASDNLTKVKTDKEKFITNTDDVSKHKNKKDVKKFKSPTPKSKLNSNDDSKNDLLTNVNLDLHLKPCKLNFDDEKSENKENIIHKIKEKPKTGLKKDKPKAQIESVPREKPTTYSFMASLADNLPSWRRDLKAKYYIENFKTKKEELAVLLFKMFNENVFESQIYSDLSIFWSSKLQTTAGRAHNKLVKVKDARYGNGTGRRSRVELSNKVLDSPQRLRDTLAHELCHVAAWLIDGNVKDGHGPVWKAWVKKILKIYPEIGSIPVRHSLDIHFKYSFKCVKCGYRINRHSKSIDIDKQCCGFCHGKFECIQNKKTKEGLIVSTPVNRKKELKGFALYVKENYGNVRGANTPHKEAMKYLGRKYAETKGQSKENDEEA